MNELSTKSSEQKTVILFSKKKSEKKIICVSIYTDIYTQKRTKHKKIKGEKLERKPLIRKHI